MHTTQEGTMTKFNIRQVRNAPGTGPIQIAVGPADQPVINHQGGLGWTRDNRSDLLLLAATSHDITANAFYEGGTERVNRFVSLVQSCTASDPAWTHQFLAWLRSKANIRTAAIVGAVEAARTMASTGTPGGRKLVADVCQRADEPGEIIAYHLARHGRKLPKNIKRGVADAAVRLYNERNLLKYDTASHAVRFGDVLDLTHPTPREAWQGDLFRYAIDRRHNRDSEIPAALGMLAHNAQLRAQWASASAPADYDVTNSQSVAAPLQAAGMTWEDVLSALGDKVDKASLWRALIPSMGFMALLRNLRNFDQVGLSDTDVQPVITMLSDPEQVARSRQLPLRFLSAYRAAPSLRWSYPLERALDMSLTNVPALAGNTLILVDTSGSMADRLSERSDLRRWDAAAAFGLALARRCETAAVVSYSAGWNGTLWKQFPQQPAESLLRAIGRWQSDGYFINGGTDTIGAVRETFRPGVHTRVVILTDEQDGGYRTGSVGDALPPDVPLYVANLAGYNTSHAPTNPYRITLGGLTDAMFSVIPTVEAGRNGSWPWEQA